MSTAIAPRNEKHVTAPDIERVLMAGDLSKLSAEQRVTYYRDVCASVGLNPLTQPFEYIVLNNKLTLYARKAATDQLRMIHGVSIDKPEITFQDDWIIVSVTARTRDGRTDGDVGVVNRKDMRGDFGNAVMKCISKAKRRVTLSIAGLGMLDETEVETIPNAKPAPPMNAAQVYEAVRKPVEAPIPGYTPMAEVVDTTTGEVTDFFEGIPTGLLTEEQIGELTNRARAASPLCEAKLLGAYKVRAIEEIPASEYDNALARIEKFAAAARAKK